MNLLLRLCSQKLKLLEQALIELIYSLDISVMQIINLNLSDIIITEYLAFFRVGERVVTADGDSLYVLSNFVLERTRNEVKICDYMPFFIGLNGRRITLKEIWTITNKFSDIVASTFCAISTIETNSWEHKIQNNIPLFVDKSVTTMKTQMRLEV